MKVMICAAGSGGHIYPALRLADELSRQYTAGIVFLSTRRAIERKIFEKNGYRGFTADFVSPAGLKDGNYLKFLLKNLIFLLKFIIESVRVGKIVWTEQPDIVVGFGGIASVSAVLAAGFLRIPAAIHEQNLVPGRANRFLARFATKVTLGFVRTAGYFPRRDTVYTGNPLRSGLERIQRCQARSNLGLEPEKFTVLVIGGSQGSEFLNKAFSQGVQYIPEQLKCRMQVLHSTGCDDNSELVSWYHQCSVTAQVISYCEDMSSAFSAADIVVCRAGAGTLNELNYFGLPAILIPYPFAQAHQVYNARLMQGEGAAEIILQDKESTRKIGYLIARMMQDAAALEAMGRKSRGLSDDGAAARLARLVVEIIAADRKS